MHSCSPLIQEFFHNQLQAEYENAPELQELEEPTDRGDSTAASTNGTPQPAPTATRIRLVSSSARDGANGDKTG
jgi:hypothetical protein